MQEIMDIFLLEKPSLLITSIRTTGSYANDIRRQIDTPFSHVANILKVFREKGLITEERKGRLKEIKLTEKGKEVVELINRIKSL